MIVFLRLWIHHDTDQGEASTEDRWVDGWIDDLINLGSLLGPFTL